MACRMKSLSFMYPRVFIISRILSETTSVRTVENVVFSPISIYVYTPKRLYITLFISRVAPCGREKKMQKEKAIALIQMVKKGVSRQQVEGLIAKKLSDYDSIVSEEGAVDMVLQDLGIAAPVESFRDRKARMEAEPEGGVYLKASESQVGDQVKIISVTLGESRTLDKVDAKGKPVVIPPRPEVTGLKKVKGSKEWGAEVKFSLNKSNEKNLYGLWGRSLDECVGLVLMVSAIQKKVINGADASWIEWTGLPE